MQTIIGLGSAGCKIADCFKTFPQYNVLNIDTGLKKSKTAYNLKYQDHPEKYEASFKVPKGLLDDIQSECLFITSCGHVSSTSLKILQEVSKKSKVQVMYLVPDKNNLTKTKKLHNNLLFNVFQEYARSGVFESVFLVDNKKISDIIGPVPILKYWDSVNQLICATYNMINIFEHTEPVFTTFSGKNEAARIKTLGISSLEQVEKKSFFSLDLIKEEWYYYAIPQKMLEEDVSLMQKIQTQITNAKTHDAMKVGYSVYTTEYDVPYVYCLNSTTLVQTLPAS